jgi:hypothetical protein
MLRFEYEKDWLHRHDGEIDRIFQPHFFEFPDICR